MEINRFHHPFTTVQTRQFLLFYLLLTLRYLLIAGPAFLVFYVLFRKKWGRLRVQPPFPRRADYYREIGYSFLTFVIFALFGLVLVSPAFRSVSHLYADVSEYGGGYLALSFFASLLIHDAYFYATHRLMHHPRLFRLFHRTHHRSTNPSPWAAFAFNPAEAVVEGAVILVIPLLIPVHTYTLLAFLLFMTVYNVYGHLGYEIYPKWLVNSRLGRWLNTSTNHNMHHQNFKGNYGLYFRFWDEAFGTTHPHYEQKLASLLDPPKARPAERVGGEG